MEVRKPLDKWPTPTEGENNQGECLWKEAGEGSRETQTIREAKKLGRSWFARV